MFGPEKRSTSHPCLPKADVGYDAAIRLVKSLHPPRPMHHPTAFSAPSRIEAHHRSRPFRLTFYCSVSVCGKILTLLLLFLSTLRIRFNPRRIAPLGPPMICRLIGLLVCGTQVGRCASSLMMVTELSVGDQLCEDRHKEKIYQDASDAPQVRPKTLLSYKLVGLKSGTAYAIATAPSILFFAVSSYHYYFLPNCCVQKSRVPRVMYF